RLRRPPPPTSFAYTTLFRSPCRADHHRHVILGFGRELVVHAVYPEPLPRVLAEHPPGAPLPPVVTSQRQLDAVVQFAHALVEVRSEEHTSELQSREKLVCSL